MEYDIYYDYPKCAIGRSLENDQCCFIIKDETYKNGEKVSLWLDWFGRENQGFRAVQFIDKKFGYIDCKNAKIYKLNASQCYDITNGYGLVERGRHNFSYFNIKTRKLEGKYYHAYSATQHTRIVRKKDELGKAGSYGFWVQDRYIFECDNLDEAVLLSSILDNAFTVDPNFKEQKFLMSLMPIAIYENSNDGLTT